MTHFYQLWKRVPRSRRKNLARFIHELKKLATKYNCLVIERLGNRHEDYVYIDIRSLSDEQQNELREKVWELGDTWWVPRFNIDFDHDGILTNVESIYCYLYTDL